MKKELVINELMKLDSLFCEESKNNGVNAWIKYFSKDGVMISQDHNPNIKGEENIKKSIVSLYDMEGFELVWEPLNGDVSDDYTFGYTTGKYIMKYIRDGKPGTSIGKYVSIWKKRNAEWEITLDMGN